MSDLAYTRDLSAAWARVQALPEIRLENADALERDYGLEIAGPDGDGLVYANIEDRQSGAKASHLVGRADSAKAKPWLAWRDARRVDHST